LFGLLAVELAVSLTARNNGDATLTHILALVFFLVSVFFVWRSFHGMRIGTMALESRPAEREVVKSAAGD
jgi:K(+)-stimulated pyrophosphate-energized sodium pump